MAAVYDVKRSPNKGFGVFAKYALPPGTLILQDKTIMRLPSKSTQYTDEEVHQAFEQLSEKDQARVLERHEGHRAFKTKLMRIFKANAFGDQHYTRLYPNVSRINHSCVPNAEMGAGDDNDDETKVIATQAIGKGEEIFISYKILEDMTMRQRNNCLHAYYGFLCLCVTCTLAPSERTLSDTRRQLTRVLSAKVAGHEPPDFRLVNYLSQATVESLARYIGHAHEPLMKPLTLSEKTAYNLMLAKLLEAEDLTTTRIPQLCRSAAYHLAEQMEQNPYILILPCAQNVISWMEKAIEVATAVSGSGSKLAKSLQEDWKEWQEGEQLSMFNSIVSPVSAISSLAYRWLTVLRLRTANVRCSPFVEADRTSLSILAIRSRLVS